MASALYLLNYSPVILVNTKWFPWKFLGLPYLPESKTKSGTIQIGFLCGVTLGEWKGVLNIKMTQLPLL